MQVVFSKLNKCTVHLPYKNATLGKLTVIYLFTFHREIKGICGLTQEIVIGLIANLESREIRRIEYQERGFLPEHPRASSTDDVEGIIGLIHDMLGNIFDLKQFGDAQPKILNEFSKRINYWR